MASFFASLFGGSNPVLNQDISNAGAISSFSTGVGEGDVTAASKWYRDILSGNPSEEAAALAPEISSAQARAQQGKKTRSEFGTRSGGTAAANAAADAGVSTDILNLEGGLKSSAASGAAQLGTAEQGLGLSANEQQAQEAQIRQQNWENSILGKAITGGLGAAESFGLGKLFNIGGGGGETAADIVGTPMPNPEAGVGFEPGLGFNPSELDPTTLSNLDLSMFSGSRI